VEVVGEVVRLHCHGQLYALAHCALAFLGGERGQARNGWGDGRGGLCGEGFIRVHSCGWGKAMTSLGD
jgi:hypothetical protein